MGIVKTPGEKLSKKDKARQFQLKHENKSKVKGGQRRRLDELSEQGRLRAVSSNARRRGVRNRK